ncbi:MAG: SGNH/GDSL hydrolase family protein [Cyanobacteria bacterium P01_H01_bin.15]
MLKITVSCAMLFNPFRRRRLYATRSSFGRNRKRSVSWGLILLAVPLGMIGLEFLARITLNLTAQEKTSSSGANPSLEAYQLQFTTASGQVIAGLPITGQLQAELNATSGYELSGNQENAFWQINEQGFRDHEPVPLVKPEGEVRIFILGGSTAFGQWSQGNQNAISNKLESLLAARVAQQRKQPDEYQPETLSIYRSEHYKQLIRKKSIHNANYRVINAAVPGYASGNELARLALNVFPYSPDAVIVMNGYADLLLPSEQTLYTLPELEQFLTDAGAHYRAQFDLALNNRLHQFSLVQAIQRWTSPADDLSISDRTIVGPTTPSLIQQLPQDDKEFQARLDRYKEHQTQMIRLVAGRNIPIVLATQPEITGRSMEALSPSEEAMLQELGQRYQETVSKYYPQLRDVNQSLGKAFNRNARYLDFYAAGANLPAPAFQDPIHLTAESNTKLATALYETVTMLSTVRVTPKDPTR